MANAATRSSRAARAVRSRLPRPNKVRRAITLAGGGPAAGLHIGALTALEEEKIEFDVWSLSCIGAWVGVVYNTREGENKAEKTYDFFHDKIFRDDASYNWFPVNRAFGPDLGAFARAWATFLNDRWQYFPTLVQPSEIMASGIKSAVFLSNPLLWNEADFNLWALNDVLAVNPASRFITSLLYLSQINGLSRIFYPDSEFLKSIGIDDLKNATPEIYHNAWNLTNQEMDLFHNRPEKYGTRANGGRGYSRITPASLCACSALPYVEQTVTMPETGDEYSEGALVDTVSFKDLLFDHTDLEQIWVNRIVDLKQIKHQRTLTDSMANLCMQFAAEVGESDIKLFRQHLRKYRSRKPKVVEIPILPNTKVNFEWSRSNLDQGCEEGYYAVKTLLAHDESLKSI
ncbi:MAG: patatin-like phospholipase family protein [Burkholderiales bacterium]